MAWETIASDEDIAKVKDALTRNGIEVFIVESREEAKAKVFEIIPRGSRVMTATSQTAEELGLIAEIDESGNYDSARKFITSENDETVRQKIRRSNAPDHVVGSVHAVTHDGEVLVASNSGSQIPLYSYTAKHVIWVVGAQKVVENFDDGMRRIYEHSLLLEDRRVRQHREEGSEVNKILVIKKEKIPGRIKMVIVKDVIGF